MPRTMYDSITATDIPQGVEMVAGYVDGIYKWTDADWLYHHASRLVSITAVDAVPGADVIDIEAGAFTPAQAAQWAAAKQARGEYPTLYFSESRMAEVQQAMGAVGVHSFGIWRANWNDSADLQPNDLAHQYANPTITGQHYDKSVVRDYWPGVDPAPAPPPPPPGPLVYTWRASDGATSAAAADLATTETAAQLYASLHPGITVYVNDSAGNAVQTYYVAPGPGPTPPPVNPPAAATSFWTWAADVVSTQLPALLRQIWDAINVTKSV